MRKSDIVDPEVPFLYRIKNRDAFIKAKLERRNHERKQDDAVQRRFNIKLDKQRYPLTSYNSANNLPALRAGSASPDSANNLPRHQLGAR